ncbi:MFS transporter [Natronolimnobius baerhuensis]|uniref:MFS transporter n=1 Tax=Natronolimnobius baerhuensis TaxID=253108 RepID=A0A202EDJ3_9EURY|nr:MFS transporter [Natronolimnobius baerhuensis]OVE86277.1 MFS transporter [Natronolimnobius baerhuensis]
MNSVTSRLPGGDRPTSRTRLFGSLCTLVFLVNLGRLIYAPLLEPLRDVFGVGPAAVGLLATLAWVGSTLPRLPTGYLLTKYPRHTIVLWSGIIMTGSSIVAAASVSLEMLYVGALLMGVASGVYFVSANPLVSELFPERVGRMIGIHGIAAQFAAVIAPAFVGIVLAITLWPLAGWRVIFLAIGFVSLCSTVVFYVLAKRATLPDAGAADRNLRAALLANWRLIVTAVALVGFIGLVWNGVFNLYATYLVDSKGLSDGVALTLLTVMFATGLPAFWIMGSLADRLPFIPLLLAITAAFAGTLYALTIVQSLAGVIAVSAIMGFVIHSLFPVSDTYVLASLSDAHRGSAYAIFSATMMPLHAVGPFAVGWLVEQGLTFDEVFRGLVVGLVLTIVGFIVLFSLGAVPSDSSESNQS